MALDDLNTYLLGETDDALVCVGEADNQAVTQAMLAQTDRHVDIFSRYLEPNIYDTPTCFALFEAIALRSRHARIRILLLHSQTVAHQGHSLLTLGKRLSSYVQFRKPAEQYMSLQEAFLIADDIGTIHRPYPDSLKTLVNFNDVQTAHKLSTLFNQIWEESMPDPELRQWVL